MDVRVHNAQRAVPVDVPRMRRLAQRAARRLRIVTRGTILVTCIDARRMRALNRRFRGHDWVADVLSFRYDGPGPIVGEILIAPSCARAYARAHGLPYEAELSRYVVHGLLHWLGHDDRTLRQQRVMRARENTILAACGVTGYAGGRAPTRRSGGWGASAARSTRIPRRRWAAAGGRTRDPLTRTN